MTEETYTSGNLPTPDELFVKGETGTKFCTGGLVGDININAPIDFFPFAKAVKFDEQIIEAIKKGVEEALKQIKEGKDEQPDKKRGRE